MADQDKAMGGKELGASRSQPVSTPKSAAREAEPSAAAPLDVCPGHLVWTGGSVQEPSHDAYCDGSCVTAAGSASWLHPAVEAALAQYRTAQPCPPGLTPLEGEMLFALQYAANTITAMRPSFAQSKNEGHAYHDQVLEYINTLVAAVGDSAPPPESGAADDGEAVAPGNSGTHPNTAFTKATQATGGDDNAPG